MATESLLQISVVLARRSRTVHGVVLQLPPGSTATDAVRASGLLANLSESEIAPLELGIWGRRAAGSRLLRDGDRVELSRPLTVDPKVARRERFVRQGARGAGLFAKRRAGAKSGY